MGLQGVSNQNRIFSFIFDLMGIPTKQHKELWKENTISDW